MLSFISFCSLSRAQVHFMPMIVKNFIQFSLFDRCLEYYRCWQHCLCAVQLIVSYGLRKMFLEWIKPANHSAREKKHFYGQWNTNQNDVFESLYEITKQELYTNVCNYRVRSTFRGEKNWKHLIRAWRSFYIFNPHTERLVNCFAIETLFSV